MKKGDVLYAWSWHERGAVLWAVTVLGFTKRNVSVRWEEGPLTGREALLERSSLRRSR